MQRHLRFFCRSSKCRFIRIFWQFFTVNLWIPTSELFTWALWKDLSSDWASENTEELSWEELSWEYDWCRCLQCSHWVIDLKSSWLFILNQASVIRSDPGSAKHGDSGLKREEWWGINAPRLISLWAAPLVGKPETAIFCNRPSFIFLTNLFIAVCLIKNSDSFMGLSPYGLDLSLQEIHIHLFFFWLVFFSGMWQPFRGGADSFFFHGLQQSRMSSA